MTREQIIALAKQHGATTIFEQDADNTVITMDEAELEAFFHAAQALEREACADIVENADTPDCGGWTAQGIADAIRNRGTT